MDDVKGSSSSSSATITFDNVGPAPHQFTVNMPTVVQIVNGVVTPLLRVLLFEVLSAIDASIPNKDQNRAVKRIIHDGFDRYYLDILREAYPDCNFQHGPGHAVTPEADKFAAIQQAIPKAQI